MTSSTGRVSFWSWGAAADLCCGWGRSPPASLRPRAPTHPATGHPLYVPPAQPPVRHPQTEYSHTPREETVGIPSALRQGKEAERAEALSAHKSPQRVSREMRQSPETALQILSNREVKKRKNYFLQVRKFAGSLMEHEKTLLITRHNGIKLVSLPKVTDTKGAKGSVL